MTKKMIAFLLAISLIAVCTGCKEKQGSTQDPETSSEELIGTFTMDSSNQFNNSICRIKQMDDALVLFELNTMEGSEEEDRASEYIMSGVMTLNDEKTGGIYESAPDAPYPFTIQFDFDKDKSGFTVEVQGDCGFHPNGHYTFVEDTIEVSEGLATELIEQLPTAATSLKGDPDNYTIKYPENLISGWFYQVDVVLNDSGKFLARFLVSKDLTCVIRVDEDIEPVLIWGNMDSTLSAKIIPEYLELEEPDAEQMPEEFIQSDIAEEQSVVSLNFDNSTSFAIGETSTVTPELPWDFPYTLELESSDPSVVTTDGNVLTGAAEGTAVLKASLTIFDSTITYEIPLEIFIDNTNDVMKEEPVG